MFFDLLVDIYDCSEQVRNAEPVEGAGALLHRDVPAALLRVSEQRRYLAAGAGIVVDARLALEYRAGVTDSCEVRNLRTREGRQLEGRPAAYRVLTVDEGRRYRHLELDLQAVV